MKLTFRKETHSNTITGKGEAVDPITYYHLLSGPGTKSGETCCNSWRLDTVKYEFTSKDEFTIGYDPEEGGITLNASDPYYYISGVKFCPYCGEEIIVECAN